MAIGGNNLDTIKGALGYYTIKLQLNVIPLHDVSTGHCSCGDLYCGKNAGKHPRISNWRHEASKNFDKVFHSWWGRWSKANIGIPTGKTNKFFAIDVDDPEILAELISDGRDWPETYSYKTGSGNRHFWFKYPEDRDITNSRGLLPFGIDVRGNGGYVVVPPSVSGVGAYVSEASTAIAEAPVWLLDLLQTSPEDKVEYASLSDLIPFENLDNVRQERYKKYTNSVITDEIDKLHALANDPDSQWDNSTYKSACNLYELAKTPWSPLLEFEVDNLIREHAPPFDQEGWTETRLNKIINSAFKRIFHRDGYRPYPQDSDLKSSPPPPEGQNNLNYKTQRYSDIEDEDYLWYEENWIPQKGLLLLVGDSSSGKSTLFAHWAGKATQGLWSGKPLNVLYFAEEDSAGAIIKPRLIASGADISRVLTVKIQEPDSFGDIKERSVNFKHHLKIVEEIVSQNEIKVIFIDPAPKFLGVDEDRDSKDMQRTVLENLSMFAEQHNLLVIMIKHNKKHQKASDALSSNDRTYGSVVWTEVPRHKLSLLKVDHELRDKFDLTEDDPVAALLKIDKNSYGPDDIAKKAFRREETQYRGKSVTFLVEDGDRKISSRDMETRPVETEEQTDRRKDSSAKSRKWVIDTIKNHGGSILRSKFEEICGEGKNPSFRTVLRVLKKLLDENIIEEERRTDVRNNLVVYHLTTYNHDPAMDLEP